MIEQVSNNSQNLIKLQRNRIDLWVTGDLVAWELSNINKIKIKKIMDLQNAKMYLSFHKSTKDSVITKLNKSIKSMNKDGTIKKIYDKFNIPYRIDHE